MPNVAPVNTEITEPESAALFSFVMAGVVAICPDSPDDPGYPEFEEDAATAAGVLLRLVNQFRAQLGQELLTMSALEFLYMSLGAIKRYQDLTDDLAKLFTSVDAELDDENDDIYPSAVNHFHPSGLDLIIDPVEDAGGHPEYPRHLEP